MSTPPTQDKDYIEWLRLTPAPSPHGAVYAHARDPQSGDHLLAFGYTANGLTRPVFGAAILEIPTSELARVPAIGALEKAGRALLVEAVEVNYRVEDVPVELWEKLAAALAAWEVSRD